MAAWNPEPYWVYCISPKTLIQTDMIRAAIVTGKRFFITCRGELFLYFRYFTTAVNKPRMIAIKISIRLYANFGSSPVDHFVLNILFNTGSEVAIMIKIADRKITSEPINIQNSLDHVFSSLATCGI